MVEIPEDDGSISNNQGDARDSSSGARLREVAEVEDLLCDTKGVVRSLAEEGEGFRVRLRSSVSQKEHDLWVKVTLEQLKEWGGGANIQDVMPDLPPAEREMLISGATAEEMGKDDLGYADKFIHSLAGLLSVEVGGGDIAEVPEDTNSITDLSVDMAKALVRGRGPWSKQEGELWLNGLTHLSDEVAESLSQFEGYLIGLDGLTNLSDESAKSLSRFVGCLMLNGLKSLSDAAAKSFHHSEVDLSLCGLEILSDELAEDLSLNSSNLYLDGLASLSRAAAKSLSEHGPRVGSTLSLNGVTRLSNHAANMLSQHKGELRLNGLASLKYPGARSLSRHKNLHVSDAIRKVLDSAKSQGDAVDLPADTRSIKELSVEMAQALSAHEWWLGLDGLSRLSDEAAAALSQHEGLLTLDGLTSLSDAAAASLSRHTGEGDEDEAGLSLCGLTSLSDAAAELLSQLDGDLHLNGLKSLSDAAAESLSQHMRILYLDGLTSLSDAAAESLSKNEGYLELNGLTNLSDAAAESLSRHDKLGVSDPIDKLLGAKKRVKDLLNGVTRLSNHAATYSEKPHIINVEILGENLIKVHAMSSMTGTTSSMEIAVSLEAFEHWATADDVAVRGAMPHISPEEQEFLMTGITGSQWDSLLDS